MFYWLMISIGFFLQTPLYAQSDLITTIAPALQWDTAERKLSLQKLCQIAGMITEKETLLNLYPVRTTDEELAADLLDFITQTQKLFKVRGNGQERWDTSSAIWDDFSLTELEPQLKSLGLLESVYPKSKEQSDAMCILGGSIPAMKNRVDFAYYLMKKHPSPYLILLAGERYISIVVDGSEKSLKALGARQNRLNWDSLTEMNALNDLIEYSPKKFTVSPQLITVNIAESDLALQLSGSIPQLLKILEGYPEIKTINFVSNQPDLLYQKEVIQTLFKGKPFTIEVIGPGIATTELKGPVEALGSYIWAAGPRLLGLLTLKTVDPEVQAGFQALYQSMPALSDRLPEQMKEKSA